MVQPRVVVLAAPPQLRVVPDADLQAFHSRLSNRIAGKNWEADYVTLPMSGMLCPYPNPGGAHSPPAGFRGGVGWSPNSCTGVGITQLAAAINAAKANGQIAPGNVALEKILDLVTKGPAFITGIPDIRVAVFDAQGNWFVLEGMHRSVALAMIGSSVWEGLVFNTLRQP